MFQWDLVVSLNIVEIRSELVNKLAEVYLRMVWAFERYGDFKGGGVLICLNIYRLNMQVNTMIIGHLIKIN